MAPSLISQPFSITSAKPSSISCSLLCCIAVRYKGNTDEFSFKRNGKAYGAYKRQTYPARSGPFVHLERNTWPKQFMDRLIHPATIVYNFFRGQREDILFIILQIFLHKASLLGRVGQAVKHENNSVGIQNIFPVCSKQSSVLFNLAITFETKTEVRRLRHVIYFDQSCARKHLTDFSIPSTQPLTSSEVSAIKFITRFAVMIVNEFGLKKQRIRRAK